MNPPDAISLFDDVVAALEPQLRSVAPFLLTRLLLRAGILDRAAMTLPDFEQARPIVEAGLREALSPGELRDVIARIDAVLRRRGSAGQPARGGAPAA